MPKRVSLKGGGLDALFGEQVKAEPPSSTPPSQPIHTPESESRPTQSASHQPQSTATRVSKQASKLSNSRAAGPDSSGGVPSELLTAIRRVVRTPGREVSYVRLSAAEKGQLAEIVYTRKRQGMRTTENEIIRLAINYLLEDHQARGEDSILVCLLLELHK